MSEIDGDDRPQLEGADAHVARGRAAYRDGAWREAFAELSAADPETLAASDLEALARAGWLLCRDDEAVRALERAYALHRDAGEAVGAARCAAWIAMGVVIVGEQSRAGGWVGLGARLLAGHRGDCVERGYLLVPGVLVNDGPGGDLEAGLADAAAIAEIGERFGDRDLTAFGLQAQGRVRIRRGDVEQGLALLDEAMTAVLAGDLASPLFTGLIYCQVIEACEEVFELRRAREWTDALARWCETQAQMFNFTGQCMAHRAWSLQLRGEWRAAIEEARRAGDRFPRERQIGAARYRQGEIHRLRGEHAAAEDAYREASARGWEPQPGLAQLRLAQGRGAAAAATIRRVLAETTDPLERAGPLPAFVEIMLACGDTEAARGGVEELDALAAEYGGDALPAMAAQARGALELAEGEPKAALIALRGASRRWQELEAPYELAQVRALLGRACRELGDEDSAVWELAAARDAFRRLGARPAAERVGALIAAAGSHSAAGLTPRELEVLRLVAAGRSNKAIAEELVLSPRTVDRHVSNILAKLDVPSRTAATAFAHAHSLV